MTARWIVWNLLLAAVPAVLSLLLFTRSRRPSPVWWLGLTTYAVFLPNAPYVLTDVIHFTAEVRATSSDAYVALVLIPKYAAFFTVGFSCYVLAVVRLERWLRQRGWSVGRLLVLDVTIHGACAVGVFLGRVFRFNSWDLLSRPGDVLAVVQWPNPTTLALLMITFGIFSGGTLVLRVAGRRVVGAGG
jgi:uncharacterized membrane protein